MPDVRCTRGHACAWDKDWCGCGAPILHPESGDVRLHEVPPPPGVSKNEWQSLPPGATTTVTRHTTAGVCPACGHRPKNAQDCPNSTTVGGCNFSLSLSLARGAPPEPSPGLREWIAQQRARVARTRERNAPGFEEQYKQGYERCLDELEEWLDAFA